MTPDQQKALDSFAAQRDSLMRDVTILRGQNENEELKCKEIEAAASDALKRLNDLNAVYEAKLKVITEVIDPIFERAQKFVDHKVKRLDFSKKSETN